MNDELDKDALEMAAKAIAKWRWELAKEHPMDQEKARNLWRADASAALCAYIAEIERKKKPPAREG